MEQEIEHEKLKMEQEVELTQIDSQERQAKLDTHWSVIEHRTRKQDIEVGNYRT